MLRLLLHKYSACFYLTLLRIIKRQVNEHKHNRRFLATLANKCKLFQFLTYLSEKTINCDIITDIVYLMLMVYRGSERNSERKSEVTCFLKRMFERMGDFPKNKRNPALRAAKKSRKHSVDIDDRLSQPSSINPDEQRTNYNHIASHIHGPV